MSAMKTTRIDKICPTCGGSLIFNPTQKTLVCKKCGVTLPVIGNKSTEKSFQSLLLRAPLWQKDTTVYCCEHCGAKSIISKFDIMAQCDYCGTASLTKTDEIPGVRPDTVVVFRLSQDDAEHQMHVWLSKRFFVPNQFKSLLAARQLRGVYFPAFTFDAQSCTKYTGVEVNTKTVTITVDEKSITETQTVHHPISGIDFHIFDDLLVLANDKITRGILTAIQPFDTNQGQVFQQAYLAGFTVCQASKEPQTCWEEAKKSMESVIRDKINTKYRDTTIENLQLDMEITAITYKYVLLPIYVGHTEYKGVKYPLFINGQTGKVYGKTPKSHWKIFSFFASFALLAFGVGIVLAMLI